MTICTRCSGVPGRRRRRDRGGEDARSAGSVAEHRADLAAHRHAGVVAVLDEVGLVADDLGGRPPKKRTIGRVPLVA